MRILSVTFWNIWDSFKKNKLKKSQSHPAVLAVYSELKK